MMGTIHLKGWVLLIKDVCFELSATSVKSRVLRQSSALHETPLSSSVPAHVEMMGLIGAGNNPMVGMTVAVAVSVQQAADEGKFQSVDGLKPYKTA